MPEQHTQDLIDAWYDGTLMPEERAELEGILLSSASARARFWATARIHALLRTEAEGRSVSSVARRKGGGRQRVAEAAANPVRRATPRARGGWLRAAAAVLALGAGMLLWKAPGIRPQPSGMQAPDAACPVRLMRQSGAAGLELPAALPGSVRLESGEATVRLASGVELSL
ncbi:MAG TPA: hypothetical protein PLT74_12130, partial [Kiritimatiellia bacterium]|nr:hypothetical protein [Kiritimatiellia bacterium]